MSDASPPAQQPPPAGLPTDLHRRVADTPAPNCRCGWAEEDWQHGLTDCPIYNDLRDLPAMGIADDNGRLDVSNVLTGRDTYTRFARYAEKCLCDAATNYDQCK